MDLKSIYKKILSVPSAVKSAVNPYVQKLSVDNPESLANKFWSGQGGQAAVNFQKSSLGKASTGLKSTFVDAPFEFGKQAGTDLKDLYKEALFSKQTKTLPQFKFQPERFKSVGKQATRALNFGSGLAGATNPLAVGGYMGIAGGLGFAGETLDGKSKEEALRTGLNTAVENFPKALNIAGVSKFTNPLIDKVGIKNGLVAKSVANVGEGLVIDKAAGFETTKESIAIDALFPIAGEVGSKVFKSADEAMRHTKAKVLKALGKKLRTSKGSYTTVDKFVKRTRPYFKSGKYASGAFLGFEPYEDENGNWKVRFDENKAALGIGAMVGGTKAVDLGEQALKNADEALGVNIKKPKDVQAISQQEAGEMLTTASMKIDDKATFKWFKNRLSNWIGERDTAEFAGIKEGIPFKDIPTKDAWDVVNKIENPDLEVSGNVSKSASEISKAFDNMYKEAGDIGLDINYLKNYITHIWKQSPDEVAEILEKYRATNKSFQFGQDRTIPTYEEGIKAGLTPLYDHPAQIVANYAKKLKQVGANVRFLKDLREQGLIVPASVGWKQQGFEPVYATGFPKSVSSYNSQVFTGEYYAPAEVSRIINKLFSPQDVNKPLEVIANASKTIQTVKMSGGIGPVNSFTFAQTLKEVLAGRPIRAGEAFVKSVFPGITRKGFTENIRELEELGEHGVILRPDLTIDNFISGKQIGVNTWDKIMTLPTFKRFMPTLQLNFYKDTKNALVKSGIPYEDAVEKSVQATKNFYGLTDLATKELRGKNVDNLMSTVFFAPPYREAMINFWVNNLKAIANPLAIENRANVLFTVNAILLYAGMNKLNEEYTGHPMSENPSYMKDKLLIPYKGGHVGVPWLSSIATMPRMVWNAGMELKDLNFKEAGNTVLQGSLSSMLKPLADISANSDYFGNEVYDESGNRIEKGEDMARYLFAEWILAHPWVKTVSNKLAGKYEGVPNELVVAQALESPLRYYTNKKMNSAFYYQEKDRYMKDLSPEEKKFLAGIEASKKLDKDGLPVDQYRSEMAAATIRFTNPNIIRAETMAAIATSIKTGEPLNPYYNLELDQQMIIQARKMLFPGSKDMSALTEQNISWLEPYWTAQSQYFDELKSKGLIKSDDENLSFKEQTLTPPEIAPLQERYYSLPYGTGARKAFLSQHPELLAWWEQKKVIQNEQRLALGLPPLEDSTSGYKSYTPKLTFKKVSAPKIPKFKKTRKIKKKRVARRKLTPIKVNSSIGKLKSTFNAKIKRLS